MLLWIAEILEFLLVTWLCQRASFLSLMPVSQSFCVIDAFIVSKGRDSTCTSMCGVRVHMTSYTLDFGTVQVNDRTADTAASTVLSNRDVLAVALFFFTSLLFMSFGSPVLCQGSVCSFLPWSAQGGGYRSSPRPDRPHRQSSYTVPTWNSDQERQRSTGWWWGWCMTCKGQRRFAR